MSNENFSLSTTYGTKMVGNHPLISQWVKRHNAVAGESELSTVTSEDIYVATNTMEFDDMQGYQAAKRKRQQSHVTYLAEGQMTNSDAGKQAAWIDDFLNNSNSDRKAEAERKLRNAGYSL